MNTRSTFVGIGLFLLTSLAVAYFLHRSIHRQIGPQHIYELPEQPQFLTEELAMEKARETLIQGGLDASGWRPVPDGRTKAPDGSPDHFISRNSINPNHGSIMFTNGSGSRFVSVELDGRQVICQTSVGK